MLGKLKVERGQTEAPTTFFHLTSLNLNVLICKMGTNHLPNVHAQPLL